MASTNTYGGHGAVGIPPEPESIHGFEDAMWSLYYMALRRGMEDRFHAALIRYVSAFIASAQPQKETWSIELFKWKVVRTLNNKLFPQKLVKNDKPKDLKKHYLTPTLNFRAFKNANLGHMSLVELIDFISSNGNPDYPRPLTWGHGAPTPVSSLRPRPQADMVQTHKGPMIALSFMSRPGFDLEMKARWVPVERNDATDTGGHSGDDHEVRATLGSNETDLNGTVMSSQITMEEKSGPDGTVTFIRVPDWTQARQGAVFRKLPVPDAPDAPDAAVKEEEEEEVTDDDDADECIYMPPPRRDFATSVQSILDLPIEEDLSIPAEETPFDFEASIEEWYPWAPLTPEKVY
ncbi:hypothetical protein F5X96DRAFT_670888 [Biscogniauxia mediterranea]|nr:hypothetical protein F5X96DRAFT_670888 [Biscogniauxia mediterranea]